MLGQSLTQADVTPAVKEAVKAYLMARARAEVIRAEVDKIERAILAECPLTNGLEQEYGEPARKITEPKYVYLCTDEVLLADYYAECNHRERKAGLKPAEMPDSHCPALCAEELATQAEWAIETAAAVMLGLPFDGKELNGRLLCMGLDVRHRFIDLIVKLVVNLPDFKNPLTGQLVNA